MVGKDFDCSPYAKYLDPNQNNWTAALQNLMAAIAGGTAPAGTVIEAVPPSGGDGFPFEGLLDAEKANDTGTRAYLNILLFDEGLTFLEAAYVPVTDAAKENGTNAPHERLNKEIVVQQPGYAYIYLSNDNDQPLEVFFDDFTVIHSHSVIVQADDYYPFGLTFNSYRRENSMLNRFLYNGKELQQDDLGLGWYAYGARNYDASIGRFFNQDRFSDKYFDFSPYQYAGNNPINNIDINGDWIWVINDGQNYKYDNGKFYTYDKDKSKYVEYTPEENNSLSGLLQGLNDLSSKTDQGNKLVGFFGNEDNNAFIEMGEAGSGNSEGYGDITVNSSFKGSEIPTENGIQESPFWLDLGHELAHAKDYLTNGESVYDVWVEHPDRPNAPIRQSEKYATHIENKMRSQIGLPLRTHYARQGNGGYEPTRILNVNGGSIFYNVSINFQGKELKSNAPQIYRTLYKRK